MLMPFIESFLLISSVFILATLIGLGPVLTLLPKVVRPYSAFVATATGYVLFCFFSIWFSGLFNLAVIDANWCSFSILVAWTLFAILFRYSELKTIAKNAKPILFILLIMFLVVFFPVLHKGVDLYIGTANPDFYQSLSFQESLKKYKLPFWVNASEIPALKLNNPFIDAFPQAFQARFGAVAFSVFIEQISHLPARTILLTSIIVFLSCLPLVVYFFSRFVLEFTTKNATLAALFIAIAAPISMSFQHILVGQNSALAIIPLAITYIYMAIKEKSFPLTILCILIINGLMWLYVMVLPYILVPLGLFILIRFAKCGWQSVKWIFFSTLVFISTSILIHSSIIAIFFKFFNDLKVLSNQIAPSSLFADFLTEDIFAYFFGLSSYPVANNLFFNHIPAPALFILGLALTVFYLYSIYLWSNKASKDAILLVLCLMITYFVVWANYTFFSLYGYAIFKMVAWLQFLLAPFLAWGTSFFLSKLKQYNLQKKIVTILTSLSFIYIGCNLLGDVDYAMKSYGHNIRNKVVIVTNAIANNKDYLNLTDLLKNKVKANSSIALGFNDKLYNIWAGYYVHKANLKPRIISHEDFPLEELFLPHPITNEYKDILGRTQIAAERYFYSGDAEFYLLPSPRSLNKDIILNQVVGEPIWSNDTFALYKKGVIKDLIVTGRGFHLIEYTDNKNVAWWWPKTSRWSAEGGQIFHLYPSMPGNPHQISLLLISGMGLENGLRTVELWHNNSKFDEIIVNGAAKVISKEYFPIDGVNKIIIRPKEIAKILPRNRGFWNRNIRLKLAPLNILMSNIEIINSSNFNKNIWKTNDCVRVKQMFEKFTTFNGFDVDGWVRNEAEFSFTAATTASRLRLKFVVPKTLGFIFPYEVKFILNEITFKHVFSKAGEHEIILPLPTALLSPSTLNLKIQPKQTKLLANGLQQSEILRSIQIKSLELLG